MLRTCLRKVYDFCYFMIAHFRKKNFMPLFMDGVQLAQGYRATTGRQFSLVFTKFPESPGTHLINLGRMKGWVNLEATQWFWSWDPLNLSSCINGVITKYKLKSKYVKLTKLWPLTVNYVKMSSQSYLADLS